MLTLSVGLVAGTGAVSGVLGNNYFIFWSAHIMVFNTGRVIRASVALLVIAACTSTPRKNSADSGARAPQANPADRAPFPSPVEQVPVDQEPVKAVRKSGFVIEVSEVTEAGLVSIGMLTEEKIAAWFNAPSGDGNPFFEPMFKEIEGIDASAEKLTTIELSAPTRAVLLTLKLDTPKLAGSLSGKRLKACTSVLEECRLEIEHAMLKLGWAAIRANISNVSRATQLSVNAVFLGALELDAQPVWRRFLCRTPGHMSDQTSYVVLSVDIPDALTGMPVARWFKDIQITKGKESTVTINVGEAPTPSIAMEAGVPVSPGAIYAGDKIRLRTEQSAGETIWILHWGINELTSDNYQTAPAGSQTIPGLPGWLRVRRDASKITMGGETLLDESWGNIMVLGRGAELEWTPEFESSGAHIGVITRNADGFWGYADRPIAIVDLRPPLWIMPVLEVDEGTALIAIASEEKQSVVMRTSDGESVVAVETKRVTPTSIYLTHSILSQLVFLTVVGATAEFDFNLNAYRDAGFPLVTTTVDFGDLTPIVTLDGAAPRTARIPHVYAAAGQYRVTVTSRDVMGFTRTHGTNVLVAQPSPDAVVAVIAVREPEVRLRMPAESSFVRFRAAAGRFAGEAVDSCMKGIADKTVAISSIHEQSSLALLDLMDSTLMSELLSRDIEPYEWNAVYLFGHAGRGFVNPTPGVAAGELSKAPVSMVDDNPLAPMLSARIPWDGDLWLVDPTQRARPVDSATTVTKTEREDGTVVTTDVSTPASSPVESARVLFAAPTMPPMDAVETVLVYKLKRADVSLKKAGLMRLRTARIFAFVRLIDRETAQVLSDAVVEVNYSDMITEAESDWGSLPWDAYPDGFMLQNDNATDAQKK